MTIRHLNIFVAVADYGSMSAAATHLYLSQPTVSQAIRELEKHYNVLLFERLGKKLYLTERGELLLPRARELVRQFLTPRLIPELQKSCPDVKVSSYVSNTRAIEQKLLRSELDVGIVEGEIYSPDLHVLPIVDDRLVLAVGKEHPFYLKKVLHVQDLEQEQFAMREQGRGTRQLFEDYATRHQISFQTVWEANSPGTLLNAVLYDGVLSVMSLRLMYHEIRNDSIHVFQNENGEWNRKFKLVYHKNKFLTPAVHELERILHSYRNVEIPENAAILR